MTNAATEAILKRRLWLFDFDNTLAALERQVDWAASRRQLESFLRAKGIHDAVFREFPSRNLPLYNALLTSLLDDSGDSTALIRRASAIIESYELRGVENAAPLPGAIDLLLSLTARDKRIAIVTSNSSRTVNRWLAQHHLIREVGIIVGRDSLLPLKPSPQMLTRAVELSDGSASEAVLVGDSEADLMAADSARVSFLGIAAEPKIRSRLHELGAQKVFSSPAELAHCLAASLASAIE